MKSGDNKSDTLQNLKKTVALLEVPSQFQTPPRCVVSGSMDSLDQEDNWNPNGLSISSSQETLTELNAKISTLSTSIDDVVEEGGVDGKNEEVVKTNDEKEDVCNNGCKTIDSDCCHDNNSSSAKKIDISKDESVIEEKSMSRKDVDMKEISGSDNFQTEHVRKENSERDKNLSDLHSMDDITKQSNDAHGKKPVSVMPTTAPQNLDATFVDYDRHWNVGTTLAHNQKQKNEPQLVRIRKINSVTASDFVS